MQILSICLGRFRAEGLNFTGEEIRNMIARRDEVEKMRIIGKLDRMSPEEKAAELINKRLGLGDWAIGGSKAIREHNEQQYERERRERGEMVGLLEGAPAADETEGYDNAQTGDDDY
jgi:3-dehydroquinate synthase class II